MLLQLPAELRTEIYSLLFAPWNNRREISEDDATYNYREALALFRVNRQIYLESRKVFQRLNSFVLIETPWTDAKHHVAVDGHVYLLCAGAQADNFKDHTMHVTIQAPQHHLRPAMDRFVIVLDDLDKFCTSWYYSHLSMPGLNQHLSLHLYLRDPYAAVAPAETGNEEKLISPALQRRLLAPFGKIKGLLSLTVDGDPKPLASVEADMRAVMAIPLDSPESCLLKSTKLKDEGNVALQTGHYTEALELYRQAWHAIHIIVSGKQRHVHGDNYFDRELTDPNSPFVGRSGSTERTLLRIRLVANSVLAYLKLNDLDMAVHTGMRTIRILRFSIGVDENEGANDPAQEAFTSFFAAAEMGKIYYRTALAYKGLDDKYEARRLLKVAVLYLPNDQNVHREIRECALRIM
ncbi:hypothetical protein AAFC00_003972 [Neodothiora populina]|uniref:Uncharacterized protein n=1 Tax=Neodothiora populina TaxID=2781224 RepID=A0ABR3PIC1_9PEZI